jgi:elongation factor P
MASTSEIRNGLCIDFNHDIWQIIEFLHVKPGKGNAFVRSKLKSLTTGKVLEHTFPSGATLNEVRVERRVYQYLYMDEFGYNFMNVETFEQVSIPEVMIDGTQFLKEGQEVEILLKADDEKPLLCELPAHIVLEIIDSEPGVKGNTATNASKNATLETGAGIQVPLFVNIGDKIKIDTRTKSYVERVKE